MYLPKCIIYIIMIVKRIGAGLKRSLRPGNWGTGAIIGGLIGTGVERLESRKDKDLDGAKWGAIFGAAIGAGVGAVGGYKRGVREWDEKNDPEYIKKKKENDRKILNQEIREKISELSKYHSRPDFLDKELKSYEKKYGVILRKDLYRFIKFTIQFYRKNLTTWYNCMKNCNNPTKLHFAYEFDELFAHIYIDSETYWERDFFNFATIGDDNGLEYWPKEDAYSFTGGDGFFKNFSELADIIEKFFKQSLEPYQDDPDVLRIHQSIVDEYCRGLKQIR